MSRSFRLYGPHVVAGLVLLMLAAPGTAQTPGAGTVPTNTGVLGRGISTLPGYGTPMPYFSTAPSLISSGPTPSSISGSPYSLSTIPGGYVPSSSPSYQSYYPPPYTYVPPAAATLMGAASLTSASGQYWNQIQQARLLREQSYQASIDTRRKLIEYELWYETVRPTAPKMLAKEKATDIDWARNYAQNSEIWSGRTLNVLLKSVFASPSPTRGPNIPLDETTLRGLNLTDMTTRGNLALAKDDGKIDWPEALQDTPYDEVRDRFSKNFNTAIKTVQQGEQPPIALLRDLRADLKSLDEKLDEQVRDLPPSRWIEGRRQLNKLKDTIKGLSNARICKSCNDSWKKNVRTVAELVAYCMKNGLEFGPAAAPGDSPCYTAAYYALRSYERETVLMASR
jgi:hypothetical protein